MRQRTGFGAAVVSLLLAAGGAAAAEPGFAGTWVNATATEGGVARVVVTEDGTHRLALHVFGKCQAAECDWGVQPGHGFSDDPFSDALGSVSAEFDTAATHRRLTLQWDADAQMHFADGFHRWFGPARLCREGRSERPGAPPVAVTREDSGGFFSGWGLGRAKRAPKTKTAAGDGGILSRLGLGDDKPAAATSAATAGDTGGLFSGWGLGRAKPRSSSNADSDSGDSWGGLSGWGLGPAKPRAKPNAGGPTKPGDGR